MDTLRMLISRPQLLVQPSIVFVATFAAGYIARALLLRALRAWVGAPAARAGQIVFESLRGPTVLWALILALHVAIQSSALPRAVTERWAPGVLIALWGASFTLMLMRVAGDIVRHWGAQIPGALPVTALTQTLAQLAVLILGIVLILERRGREGHAHPHGLGRGRPGGGPGATGHAFEPLRRLLHGGGAPDQPGRLRQTEHRRRRLRRRYHLAQHHFPRRWPTT